MTITSLERYLISSEIGHGFQNCKLPPCGFLTAIRSIYFYDFENFHSYVAGLSRVALLRGLYLLAYQA